MDQIIDYKETLNLPCTDFPMKGDGPRREPEIQKFWHENKIYHKCLDKRKQQNTGKYLLHDGPPYLSSPNIHIGTALNKILKDIVVKYKTLKGLYSPYLPGFDCHGLPIETAVLSDKKKDDHLSALEIRKRCEEFVLKNRKSQEEKFKRLGVLGDWENSYMTIYPKFEAYELRLFGQMVDKGYIYRGLKSVYWCPVCETALAEAEVEYVENHKSPSIYVAFDLKKLSLKAKRIEKHKSLRIVIWTTTPWTIPGNMAICLNKDFEYSIVASKKFGNLIIASDLLASFNNLISEETIILDKIIGSDLEQSICKHPLYDRESPVILGDHVTLETGTGCVHTAPGHGLEDFLIGLKYKIINENNVLSPVNAKGLLTEEAGEKLKGLHVYKGANEKVIELLSECGALISQSDYFHSYPYCWRSKTPIIFRATEQWFCSVEKFRKEALKAINTVKWIPEIGKNRITSMVESRTDWCISRQRVWGVPIPAFYCTKCNETHLKKKIVDDIANIVEQKGTNAWWEMNVQELIPSGYKCKCGSTEFKKESDIMDVWFDSGSTHYSVVDQTDELKNISDVMYLEGSDQHRGWFQSSLLTSVAIKGKAPYSEVLTHGFVLDEHGKKMSKSLGNVVDPEKVISEYGADILRLWVASVDYSSDMRIGQNMLKQLAEVYRNIRNTLRFILANLYDYDESKESKPSVSYDVLWAVDKFALHRLSCVKEEIDKTFSKYEFYKFYQILQNYFTTDLSGFYFDIVKDRLYTGDIRSRTPVQIVLSEHLKSLLPIISPVLPHLAEDVCRHYPKGVNKNYESVLFFESYKLNPTYLNNEISTDFKSVLQIKENVFKALEIARAEKKIGKSLEAKVLIIIKDKSTFDILTKYKNELPSIYIVSQVEIFDKQISVKDFLSSLLSETCDVYVFHASGEKCPRCWKYCTDIGQDLKHKTICVACAKAVEGLD